MLQGWCRFGFSSGAWRSKFLGYAAGPRNQTLHCKAQTETSQKGNQNHYPVVLPVKEKKQAEQGLFLVLSVSLAWTQVLLMQRR